MATLNVSQLESLAIGDTFDIQVDGNDTYNIRINEIKPWSNGDHSWYGSITSTGLDYALVITVGNQTAHLILTSPSGIFQLYGITTDGVFYTGRFARLNHVRDEVASVDTILLPPGTDDVADTITPVPPISITQVVSHQAAPVGATLTFDLTFRNNTLAMHTGQFVDIFFILENTELQQLPGSCQILKSTDNQPVLSCELGNFGAGQEKKLSFSVTTSLDSHPLVWSTARVGDVRNDVIVDIYRDVITDTDGDGTSDYNEGLLGTNPASPDGDMTAYIDVLVAYTADIKDIYLGEIETRINQIFTVANKIFSDSRTGIVLRPVGIHEVAYQPAEALFTDLSNITFQSDNTLSDLARKRSLYGGDLVVLFRSGGANGLCGLANLGGKGTQADFSAAYHKEYAYSVINIDCMDDSVLAHEVGHNLGLVHSRREDGDGGTLAYSTGFGEPSRFVTVMAYPNDYDVENRLYRFSDPARACGQFLCGEDRDDPVNGADAVSSLKLVKHQVARYFPSQEKRIATFKTLSSVDGAVDAAIGVAAYSDTGSDFQASFLASDKLNLRMKIKPTAQHVGRQFVPHLVLVSEDRKLYQITESHQIVSWNGSLNSLVSSGPPGLMEERVLLDVIKGIDLAAVNLLNKRLQAYVAYRITGTGELVYGTSPFSFSVSGNP